MSLNKLYALGEGDEDWGEDGGWGDDGPGGFRGRGGWRGPRGRGMSRGMEASLTEIIFRFIYEPPGDHRGHFRGSCCPKSQRKM